MLRQGSLYRYENRIWRCGLVNISRARLDPVSGFTVVSPVSGRGSFLTYGSSVNVSPNSVIPEVSEDELNDVELKRLMRIEEEEAMAVAAPPVGKAPQKEAAKSERREKLAKEPKEPKAKAEKKMSPCKCGCGEMTGGFFYPGHDARFKGWMLKIERGQAKPEDLLSEEVRKAYKWTKTEKGLRTTTNYKGEPHEGYDQSAK